MTIYNCNICEREFRQKCHLIDHLNKKKPCLPINNNIPQKSSENPQKTSGFPHNSSLLPLFKEDIIDLILKKPTITEDNKENINKNFTCMYILFHVTLLQKAT
jgi:hypothetical protein